MRSVGVAFAAVAVFMAGSAPGVATEALRPRHLIYLHGRIVQERQSTRPRHPQFGYYELEKILDAFRDRGFDVSGEIRPKAASVTESADRVVAQVRRLLASGVPPTASPSSGPRWARPSRSRRRHACETPTCASVFSALVCPRASAASWQMRERARADTCFPSAKRLTIRQAPASPGRPMPIRDPCSSHVKSWSTRGSVTGSCTDLSRNG
jgi:hypothetical protein